MIKRDLSDLYGQLFPSQSLFLLKLGLTIFPAHYKWEKQHFDLNQIIQ